MRKVLVVALFTLVVVPAVFAAQSTPGTLTVTANVTANCTINNATLAFGNYDPTAALATPGSTVMTVRCTKGLVPVVTLGQGSNPAGGSTAAAPLRQMAGTAPAAERLSYQLFQDSGYLTVWGGTVATGVGVVANAAGTAVTVYGTIAPGQNVTNANTFSDSVQAIVNY
jgi:spore coat protein U-like protein